MENFGENLDDLDNNADKKEIEILRVPDIDDENFQLLKKQEGLTYTYVLNKMNDKEKKQYIQKEREILSEQIRDMDKNGHTEEHPEIRKNKAMLRALYELEN